MKKIFLIASVTLTLAACESTEDNTLPATEAAKITATIGESTTSRAVDESWSAGDKIGISSTVGTLATPYVNVEYTTTGGDGIFEGDTKLYFYKPMTLTAYYPFSGSEGTAPGPQADGILEADTRPDNQKPENQPAIDFLWDSQTGFTASEPNVDFKFAHKMSKVTFTFQNSPAVELDDKIIAGPVDVSNMINYTLNGLVMDGTFNTNTGVCAVKTDTPDEPLAININNVKDDVAVLPLIVFPQTLKDGYSTLEIFTDELNDPNNLQHYKCNLSFSDGEIKPGYHYKYTIKVSKTGLIVGKMIVVPWKEESKFMTATIDGEDIFK